MNNALIDRELFAALQLDSPRRVEVIRIRPTIHVFGELDGDRIVSAGTNEYSLRVVAREIVVARTRSRVQNSIAPAK